MDVLQLVVSGLANGCVYGLVAMGFVLIYKATEAVNFAQGDFMMLGAFICLGLTNSQFLGLPFWISVPIAIVIMGVFGYLLDLVVLRRMFGQSQVAVIILTIALGFVLRFVAGLIWGHEPISLQTPMAGQYVRFGGLVLGLNEVIIILVTVALTVILYFYFNRTKLGVAMQASSQNQLAAYYMGIPVQRLNGMIWGLSAGVAAVAAMLLAPITFVHANMGLIGLKAFPAAVVGGFGSLPGAIVGGLVIGLVESFSGFYLPEGFKDIAAYVVVLIMLAVKPNGLFGDSMHKKV